MVDNGSQETPVPPPGNPFDRFAPRYDSILRRSLSLSGEGPAYFADYKLRCLERWLGRGYGEPVLDFGCGVGTLTARLAAAFPQVHGYDSSGESIRLARQRVPCTFHAEESSIPDSHFGLVVLANVLHHVAPADRQDLLRRLARKLRQGSGRLAVFEHNPLNPLTRRVVSRCELDANARLLWPWQLTRLLRRSGFASIRCRAIVFFPKALAPLRRLEPGLFWLPLGAQLMAVGRLR